MRKQKRVCLKICALLMSLMLLCVFMPIEAFGESEENIDITSWKITTGGSVKVDLQIEKESDTGEYYLNIPDTTVSDMNSNLNIQAPESYKGSEFEVTYDSFTIGQEGYNGKEKKVTSSNGALKLADYLLPNAINYINKYVYSKQIKFTIEGKEYIVKVKPYCALQTSLALVNSGNNISRPKKQLSENEWTTTAVKGQKYKIVVGAFHKNKNITINGTEIESNTFVYQEEGTGATITVVISCKPNESGELDAEARTYKLNIESTDKDYYPIVKNYTNNSGVEFAQYSDSAITLELENVDANTKYKWERIARIGGKAVTTELDSTSNICGIDTRQASNGLFNKYKCTITNTVDDLRYSTSLTLKVTIKALSVDPPEILTNPKTAEYKAGEKADRLTVSAIGTAGGKLTYQWYKNSTNSNSEGEKIPGETKSYYTPVVNHVGTTYYYCEIWDTQQGITCKQPAVTECAEIKVSQLELGLNGEGTEENPYLITSGEDFVKIRKFVNDGYTFADTYFLLKNDVQLPEDWIPIGNTKDGKTDGKNGTNLNPFSGIIDGKDGDTIHTITIPEGKCSLLNYVREATVKNLKIFGKKIAGYGIVEKYSVDYGADGNYNTGVPTSITIDNVTLLAGSATLKSGFIGGFASGMNHINIMNSKIEAGVTIGYDKNQKHIGSFAGTFNGTLINCVSAATVYGTDSVGGLVGIKGQSMGPCAVINSSFTGDIVATGNGVGGIVGSGYASESAPNTPVVSIRNCFVSGNITGVDSVGGILGTEPVCECCWRNGAGTVSSNCFYGKINATGKNIGGIIGFLRSYNKNQGVDNNFYLDNCGAEKAIGTIGEIIYERHPIYGKEYGIKEGSFDEKSGGSAANDSDIRKEKICNSLNNGTGSLHNWIRDQNGYPIHSDKPVEYKMVLSGKYKTEYFVGSSFDTTGMSFVIYLSDGTTKNLTPNDVNFFGFDSSQRGIKTITAKYDELETSFNVRFLEEQPRGITVYLTLYGDKIHDSDTDGEKHTLASNNLVTWISKTPYSVNTNATVKDVLEMAMRQNGMSWSNPSGNYIESITYQGKTLGEFTNGKKSGWMYTLNGTHPLLGVQEQFLNNGDSIVWHYTDDYTKEEGSDKWGAPGADEVKNVTTSGAAGSATTTAPTEVKVSGTTATATVKAENQSEILKQAVDKKSAEIILEVSKADSKGADSVQLSLEVSFVKNISDKTDADLTVNTENGKVTLDQETIKTVLAEAKGATITLEVSKVAKPTEVQKKAAGANGHLLKLTIKSGDKVISDFNKGKVKVVAEIVSKLLDKKVAAIHIADDGKIEQLAGKVLTIGSKKYYEFTTPHFSTFALVDAEELGLEVAEEPTVDAKALTAKLTPIARSAKSAKKNVKVTTSLDKQEKAIVQELKDAGYTVKYRFYRSTKKAAGYKAAVTKKTAAYTNTGGKKGTKYYYKVQVRVYDADGKLAAKTALKQCKYASRTWTKGK